MCLRIAYFCSLTIALLVVAASCRTEAPSQPSFSYFRDPAASVLPVRRIVLAIPDNATKYPEAGERFADALATELRASGRFEVVEAPIEAVPAALASGHFQEALLADAYRRHGADAVLFCGVRDYHPYWPPRVGTTVHLVSAREAITLASVDGLWDAADKGVAAQAFDFSKTLIPESELPHAEIVVRSPYYFHRFVARQIAKAMIGGISGTGPSAAAPGQHCGVKNRQPAGGLLTGLDWSAPPAPRP